MKAVTTDRFSNKREHSSTKPLRKPLVTAASPQALSTGPVTSLRVLGQGFDVDLDPSQRAQRVGRYGPPTADVRLPLPSISREHALLTRVGKALEVTDLKSRNGIGYAHALHTGAYIRCEKFIVNVGDRFAFGDIGLLALDARTRRLATQLTACFGSNACDAVDRALTAVIRGDMLFIHGSADAPFLELAQTLHRYSTRQRYPLMKCDGASTSNEEIDQVCLRAAGGTMVLDMTRPFTVPARLAQHLLSSHFNLWPIVITTADTPRKVLQCFGSAILDSKRPHLELCFLGFPRRRFSVEHAVARLRALQSRRTP